MTDVVSVRESRSAAVLAESFRSAGVGGRQVITPRRRLHRQLPHRPALVGEGEAGAVAVKEARIIICCAVAHGTKSCQSSTAANASPLQMTASGHILFGTDFPPGGASVGSPSSWRSSALTDPQGLDAQQAASCGRPPGIRLQLTSNNAEATMTWYATRWRAVSHRREVSCASDCLPTQTAC